MRAGVYLSLAEDMTRRFELAHHQAEELNNNGRDKAPQQKRRDLGLATLTFTITACRYLNVLLRSL